MAEMWKPLTKETYESWLDAIESEVSDELDDWETKFIGDIRTQLLYGNTLTRLQSDALERIYIKYTK